MSGKLVLNPHFRLESTGDVGEIVVSAAKRGAGVQSLRVSKGSNPELFELFSDRSAPNLNFLDPETDLSGANRELLRQYGIIIAEGEIPQKPCFSCSLDETPTFDKEIDHVELFVNPTFRYEPFDLTNFTRRLHEQHLSPYQPSAWVTSPATSIESGYWLSPSQAAIVSAFTAGHTVQVEIDSSLKGRLLTANILTCEPLLSEDERLRTAEILQARDRFALTRAAVIRSILPEHQMAATRRFYQQYVAEGFMQFGDAQVPGRFWQYREPFATYLHAQLVPLMTLVAGVNVKPTYVYAASYTEGAVLEPHRDRPQCEFSISFQVDFEPHIVGNASSWPLYVELPGEVPGTVPMREANTIDEFSASAYFLKSGDALFYKGCEVAHFRRALPKGQSSTSLFFHFVPADSALTLA